MGRLSLGAGQTVSLPHSCSSTLLSQAHASWQLKVSVTYSMLGVRTARVCTVCTFRFMHQEGNLKLNQPIPSYQNYHFNPGCIASCVTLIQDFIAPGKFPETHHLISSLQECNGSQSLLTETVSWS